MYLFCDIDGVLIPFPGEDDKIPTTHHRELVELTDRDVTVPIWLNPQHGPLLTELVKDFNFSPVWCTSWRADASWVIGRRLGLPDWPHVELPRLASETSHPNGYLWKRDYVAAYAASDPFVWIDDDFAAPHDIQWAAARVDAGHPTLFIHTDPFKGVLPIHFILIRKWAEDLRQRRQI